MSLLTPPPGPDAPQWAAAPPPPLPPQRPLHTRPWFWVALAAAVVLVVGAVLTVVLLLVGSAVGGAVAASRSADEGPAATAEPAVEPEDAGVFTLRVGDCLTDVVPEGEVEEVPVVPCDQPHQTEAYFAHTIEAGTLPEQAAMDALVDEVCLPAFGEYVGLAYEESALFVSYLSPTEQSWLDGDRELLCLLEAPEGGELTGSARGTAQ